MAILKFDEINKLYTNFTSRIKPIPYEEYFGKMLISDDAKSKRVEFARRFEEIVMYIFTLIEIADEINYLSTDFITNVFVSQMSELVSDFGIVDDYMKSYINTAVFYIVDSTLENIDDYATSQDRAEFISENTANSVLNYEELQEAIEQGYTMKTWVTMHDNRVRESHKEVDGLTIPINEYFSVGSSEMLYPHDEENAPEECVNCRCSLEFS